MPLDFQEWDLLNVWELLCLGFQVEYLGVSSVGSYKEYLGVSSVGSYKEEYLEVSSVGSYKEVLGVSLDSQE